jgi:hypothetical protein
LPQWGTAFGQIAPHQKASLCRACRCASKGIGYCFDAAALDGNLPFVASTSLETTPRDCSQAKQQEQQRQPLQAIRGALLAAAIAAGVTLALPHELMPPAHAETPAERRKLEAQQRKELLAKAYDALLLPFNCHAQSAKQNEQQQS